MGKIRPRFIPLFLALALTLALTGPQRAFPQEPPPVSSSARHFALVIAPENFRDEELFVPLEALKKAGISTLVASTRKGPCAGMLGGTAEAETEIASLSPDNLLGIAVIGGTGSKAHLWDSSPLRKLIQEVFGSGKPVGAICLSPVVLARAGILKGKTATVWKDDATVGELTKGEASFVGEPCVSDGQVVTANGPAAAGDFAKALIALLAKEGKSR